MLAHLTPRPFTMAGYHLSVQYSTIIYLHSMQLMLTESVNENVQDLGGQSSAIM